MNETGRKTFFWYRVYCAVLAFLYLLCVIAGVLLAVLDLPPSPDLSRQEMTVISIVFALFCGVLFLLAVVALLLPAKPYNWIVGIIMIGVGMTSCAFLPFMIPLLIYWLKPETKAYFGRS